MLKNKSYKFRIYPNSQQEQLIAHHFGCQRYVWNHYLEQRKTHYLTNKEEIEAKRIKWGLNYYDNAKDLTQLKKQDLFLKEVNSQSLQATLKQLDTAYSRFFKKIASFPNFKKKWVKNSFTIPQNARIVDKKLIAPKFLEWIKIVKHREVEWRIVNATISQNAYGQYFVSLCCEVFIEHKANLWWQVWIDVWIKDFATCSDGQIFSNPKHLYDVEKQLKYAQSRRSKWWWKKRKKRVQRLHLKVANQRKDFLHKTTATLINKNQVNCIEDLNVAGMMKNHCLAKAVASCSRSMFFNFLSYKSEWYGNDLVKIDRRFPSSKTCYKCWRINSWLKLSDRERTCESCNTLVDRDLWASINILKQWLNIMGGRDCLSKQDELSPVGEAMTLEA